MGIQNLDQIDRQILHILQEDARISNAAIARVVDRAPSAVFQRVKKLEDQGFIQGYHARLDPKALGSGLMAFVMLRTAEGAQSPVVRSKLAEIPEVVEVHRVVGEDCFFLKVRTKDTDSLGELLDNRIQALPEVAGTRTTIVVQTAKDSWAIPLDPRAGTLAGGESDSKADARARTPSRTASNATSDTPPQPASSRRERAVASAGRSTDG